MSRQQRPITDREIKAWLAAGAVDRGVGDIEGAATRVDSIASMASAADDGTESTAPKCMRAAFQARLAVLETLDSV